MNDPARECFGKKRYTSEDVATTVANHVWLERHTSLRAYGCPHCGGWHVTKLNAPVRMKPGFSKPLRPAHERRAYNEQQRRKARGRK